MQFGAKDGSILEGREQSCRFHFGQGVNRVHNCFVTYNLKEYGDEFKDLSYRTIDCDGVDETVEHFGRLLESIVHNFIHNTSRQVEGFLSGIRGARLRSKEMR
jgi:hypothetical protein